MRRLVYRAAAERDFRAIANYITRRSGSTAAGRRFTRQLREQCAKLASLPGTLGRVRPELRLDIRSFSFKGYVIIFRYTSDALEIVSIIEGHRDIEKVFSPEAGP